MAKQTRGEELLSEALRRLGWDNMEFSPLDVPGKPDIVVRSGRAHPVAVFMDGCHWHGCPSHYKEPRKKKKFWRVKMQRNMVRDRGIAHRCVCCGKMTGFLVERGWLVSRVWEHDVLEDPDKAALMVVEELKRQKP